MNNHINKNIFGDTSDNTDEKIENIENTKDTSEKKVSTKEMKAGVKNLFDNMSTNYRAKLESFPKQDPESLEKKNFFDYLKYLDENSPSTLSESTFAQPDKVSDDELKYLDENDPGYVNGEVLDYDNKNKKEENNYKETGLHTAAINWGEYATKEGKEYVMMPEGSILSRWGDDEGTFMSDTETPYDKLELPIIEDKNDRSFYEVLKPFSVEISKIAKQPWNEKTANSENQENTEDPVADQYKVPVPIKELVNVGYLKKLDVKFAE